MMRTVHGDPERFRRSYWEHIRPADGSWLYFAGDGARRDADGYFWVMGRVDDVINVSGHRLGTMEIESALVSHPSVAEAAVVGRPDELKGRGSSPSSPSMWVWMAMRPWRPSCAATWGWRSARSPGRT